MDQPETVDLYETLTLVTEVWEFSSPPGWYITDPDIEGCLPQFWDGTRWYDPAGDWEKRMAELIAPLLEQKYKEGFEAGTEAARRTQDPEEVSEAEDVS